MVNYNGQSKPIRLREIWVNSPSEVFIAVDGIHQLTTTKLSSGELDDLIERMLRTSGRRVDLSQPFVDAILPDGSRLHVVLPDTGRQTYREVHYSSGSQRRKGWGND